MDTFCPIRIQDSTALGLKERHAYGVRIIGNAEACVIQDLAPPHLQASAEDVTDSGQAPGGASRRPPASNASRKNSAFSARTETSDPQVCMLTRFRIIVSPSLWDHNLLRAPQPQRPLPIFCVYERPYFLQQDKKRARGKKQSQSQMLRFFPLKKKKENDNYLAELFEICIGQYSESSCTAEESVSGERHCRSRFPLKCICGKLLLCTSHTGSVPPAPVGEAERDSVCHGALFVFPLCPIPELVRQRNVKAGM